MIIIKILEQYDDSPSKQKTRKRIIDVTTKLMLDQGIEKTTYVEICKQGNFDRRTLYRYYPLKEELVVDVSYNLLVKVRDFEEQFELSEKNGYELLEEFLTRRSKNTIEIFKNEMIFFVNFDYYLSTLSDDSEAHMRYIGLMRKERSSSHILKEILYKGVEDGSLVLMKNEVDEYYNLLTQSIGGLAYRIYLREKEGFDMGLINNLIKTILRGLKV